MNTPIYKIEDKKNRIYIKRDDLFPYSFGGNKARKGMLFFKNIIYKKSDYVVTYGSSSSNHVRIISNKCAELKIPCLIISPLEADKQTYNKKMYDLFGAKVIFTKLDNVSKKIDETLNDLKNKGYYPYFIQGGGHGNIGTQAYVDCYKEIKEYEKNKNLNFDYIFHASGTGTTQAGLVCGSIINNDNNKIIGISIARMNPRGRNIVLKSVKDYLKERNINISDEIIEKKVIFTDKYINGGYGKYNQKIIETIKNAMINYGIPMDTTYVGKAFTGMFSYIGDNEIKDKNILFIHTGGTPLFFDDLEELYE
ncbi:pyridoxal-phosphate dependent enzyme [Anaerococcus sp. AGMB00486]|uniref:Pyridoxal-phosphate dependent enzyme n=1 Tax=Anaerococcus faecalis TaxID=2742993 RepID=A0ABX2NAC5_9FIRM|nr:MULTISPECIES: pyridoxal-phosphate dependent enzyme [Anaerococcus]MDY3007209.1 pyridoxal-phosphate dependent enzyme [Anaerococcus porci]NVF11534.1 pyridoxal-phosphate dependent enzyme [Anaerococcus faecalis]